MQFRKKLDVSMIFSGDVEKVGKMRKKQKEKIT